MEIFNTRQGMWVWAAESKLIHVYFRKSILAEQGEVGEERDTTEAAAEFQARVKARSKTLWFP